MSEAQIRIPILPSIICGILAPSIPSFELQFLSQIGFCHIGKHGQGLLCKHAGILGNDQGKGLETGRSTAGKEGKPSLGVF